MLGCELDEVDTAERGGVLVLPATGLADIDALDLVGEMRHVVYAKRQRQQFAICLDHGDDQGGRGPQAGTCWRVGGGHHRHRQAGVAKELPDDPPVDRLVQR